MRTQEGLVHILREDHPALLLCMVKTYRAELLCELHPERLLWKSPSRVSASAHLDLAFIGAVPPACTC